MRKSAFGFVPKLQIYQSAYNKRPFFIPAQRQSFLSEKSPIQPKRCTRNLWMRIQIRTVTYLSIIYSYGLAVLQHSITSIPNFLGHEGCQRRGALRKEVASHRLSCSAILREKLCFALTSDCCAVTVAVGGKGFKCSGSCFCGRRKQMVISKACFFE